MSDQDPFGNIDAWKTCANTLRDMFKFTEQIQQRSDLPMPLRRDANSATIELMKMHVTIMEELLKRQARLSGTTVEQLRLNNPLKDKIS